MNNDPKESNSSEVGQSIKGRSGFILASRRSLLLARVSLKTVPQAQCFVGAGAHNSSFTWRHSEMEDAGLMSSELSYLQVERKHEMSTTKENRRKTNPVQSRIFPDLQRVVGKPMRSDDFRVFGVPEDSRHLTLGIQRVDALAGVHVPELDSAIRSTTTSRQQAVLPRAPRHALNSSLVLAERIWRQHD